MVKGRVIGILTTLMVLGMGAVAMAAEPVAAGSAAVQAAAVSAGMWINFGIACATGFAIGVAALGTGIGMGNAINGALQGTARNPEAGGKIMTTMIIGLALIESLCIYALVISFILVFKLPAVGDLFNIVLKYMGA